MSKSKGRRLAEWLRNLDNNSRSGAGGISPGSITTAKLEDDAVTSEKIADSAVATDHLANTGVTFNKLHTALVVTESDGIGNNDNDTTVATSAAIKDYVDTQVAGKDALSELSGNSDDITEGSTNRYFTNERVDDRVNSLLTAGSGITLTYNDAANTLTVAGTGSYGDSNARSALSVTTNSAGTAALAYNNSTGVFSYTPPDLSSYLTSYTESDTLDSVTDRGATTSNAITVGNLTSTGIDDNASSTALTISSAGATTFSGDVILEEATPILKFKDTDVTNSLFNFAMAGGTMYVRSRGGTSNYGDVRFQRTNDGSTHLNVFRTTTGGDVLFYDDDGSTEGLRWDASTSRLGLSDSTPGTMLQVGSSDTADSNAYVTFGKRVTSSETNLPFIGQDDYDGGGSCDLGLGARSTSGTINFYTGNNPAFTAAYRRMSIEANGDVNIAGRLNVDTSGVGAGLSSLSITTNPFTIGDLTDFNLALDSNEIQARNNGAANTLILNKHGGDVGIGTAPNHNLHIHQSDSGGCWVQWTNGTTGTNAANGAIVGLNSAEQFNIRNYENTAIDFWTNNAQRMRITNGGLIGIGTTDPQKELQINLASTTTTTVGSKGGIELYSASSTAGNGGEITWMAGSGTTERWCAISGHITTNTVNGSVGDIVFAAKGADTATTLTERMRVHGSGGGVSVSGASGDILTLVDTNLTASASNIGNVRIAWDDSAGTRAAYVGSVNSDEFWINNQYSTVVLTYAGARMFETISSGAKLYGKLTIEDSAYDNHLELNRSSEQWRFSPSTDGSLDIRRVGGTGTATLDIHDRTFIGGSGSGLLQINGASSGTEGGQINIATAASLGTYSIDTYSDDLRFLNSTTAGNFLWYKNSNAAIGMTLTGAGDLDVTGSLTTEGADGGMVLRTWPGGSTYGMLGTANMGTSEYALLTDGTNTFVAGGSGGSTYIRNGNNNSAPQMIVKPSSIDFEGGQIIQTFSDTTGNSSTNAFKIDYNCSGNDTLDADRTKTGLFVDLDSSSTGGDTTNEHRLYGIRSDVRATGDSDLMYGIYGYAESQHSAGTISTVAGVYGVGVADETSSGRTTTAYGLLGIGYGYGSGSGAAGTIYGCYARGHATTAHDKNTTAIYGGYFEAEIDDPGQAQTCTNVYGLRSLMDDDSTGNVTGTGAYGLYINWNGTWSYTNKYHIYAAGNIASYFGGEIQAVGDVTAYYSDERLKIKKGKIENALEKVNSIETFYFTNNELAKSFGYRGDELQVGVSAQSVEKVMPEVIKVAPFDADAQGNSISGEDYKTVQYDKLVPLLIESIKELKAEIEELKKGR